jgi:hypothetical protein
VNAAAHEYRELVHSLAATQAQRSAEARTVEKSYVDGCAEVAKAVTDAAAGVAAAAGAARAAATLVTDADADAATLWRELGRQLGRRWAVRLGPLPAPAVETGETDPAVPLTRAADLIAAAEQATPRRVPGHAYPVLAFIGASCAAAVALPAKGLMAAFGGVLVVTVLAQLMIFLAPFVGLPIAHRWVRDHWRTRMEFPSFALTAMSGMLTCCAIAIFIG